MKNRLLAVLTGTGLALVVAGGCDPNPRRRIMAGTDGGVGTGGVVGSVGSGGAVGTGGTASGSGGESVGTGGAPGSGGEATDGSSAGGSAEGGGTTSAGAGGQASGSGGAVGGSMGGGGAAGPEDVLDSFEDNDGRIEMVGGRQGPWHSFAESGCSNQQPARADKFMPKMGGANSTTYAAHSSGSGCGMFGGIGFELNNATTTPDAMQSLAFNASGYRGISFWAKGNCNLRVELGQKSFIPTANGGSCTSNCWNVYGSRKAQGMVPASDWKQFTILFSELEREEGPKMPAFEPGQLIGIAFKCEGATFDFWLDEIQFVK